jgi:tRNA 2-thiouridine synthesizing protein D
MRYALLILTPPDCGASARHAVRLAAALVEAGHELLCAFFFDAGVLTGAPGCDGPGDEADLRRDWQVLHDRTGVPLLLCSASAQRFGVASGDDDGSAFRIAGLGELVEAGDRADRVLTFAG